MTSLPRSTSALATATTPAFVSILFTIVTDTPADILCVKTLTDLGCILTLVTSGTQTSALLIPGMRTVVLRYDSASPILDLVPCGGAGGYTIYDSSDPTQTDLPSFSLVIDSGASCSILQPASAD